MSDYRSGTTADAPSKVPLHIEACPTCQSTAVVTTAKIPDSDSYWRCTACGDIWNPKRQTRPYTRPAWR
jgi:predicted Zn finger-like uncharacterized protein